MSSFMGYERSIPRRYWYGILALCLCILQIFLLTSKYYILAPALLPAVATLYLIYTYPEIGILVFVFAIPFEGVFEGSKLFTGTKLIGLLLIGVVAIKIVSGKLSLKKIQTPLLVPLFTLLFSCLVSGLFSQYSSFMPHYLRQLVTAIIVFFLVLILSGRLNVLLLARTIAASVAIASLVTLISSQGNEDGRAIGFLSDPNFFALLLICALPLSVYLTFHESSRWGKMAWGGASLVLFYAFQQTMSRSGLLILLAAFFLLAVHYRYLFKRLSFVQICGGSLTLIVILVGLVSLLPGDYRERILSLSSISSGIHAYEDRSLSRRSSYLLVGWEVFRENPLLGAGPGSFPILYARSGYSTAYALKNDGTELFRRAHNTYLELLAETGLVGFLSLLLLIFLGVRNYWSMRRQAIAHAAWQQAHLLTYFGVSFVAVVMFFLFLSVLNNKYFWMYLALSYGLQHCLKLRAE